MWTGIQLNTPQDVTTAGVVVNIVDRTFLQRHGVVTVERVRGLIHYFNDDTDAPNGTVRIAHKVLLVETTDAEALASDVNALDVNEKDIASRILTQHLQVLGAEAATDFVETEALVEIDVKVRVKIRVPKEALILLLQSSTANRARFLGNIRALCRVN